MAGIIKYFIALILFAFVSLKGFAEPVNLSTLVTVQNVSFENCTKVYNISAENLYYLTIAGINANRFHIEEMQSKSGYIIFNAVNKEFLASVVEIDSKTSMLKITPVNNVYYFQPGIVLNLFKYIDLNSALYPINLRIN